jgi:hypothetical protein
MLPVRQRPGIKTRKHALGPSAALTALLLAASCAPAPTEPGGGGSGGSAGSPSSGSGGSGGKPAGNTGGTPGGNGGSAGSPSGNGGSPSGNGGSTSPGGTGGTGGTSSPGGTGGSGPTDTGPSPSDTMPPNNVPSDMPTCTTEPAATPPALKKTLVARIPGGDQAGQIVGVPGEPGFYVLGHRTGKVFYVDGAGKLDPTAMATVAIKNNAGQDEQGMLGMALHPKFKENQLFYLVYTAANANIRIEELKRMSPTTSMVSKTIWDKPRTGNGAFHNGGQIAFNAKDGPDKPILYHAVGNTANKGSSGMPEGTTGRVLAHDLSGGMVASKTLAYGLRNPYRMTIDRATGDMYIGEIDDPPGGAIYLNAAGTAPGKNYGYSGGSGSIQGGLTGKEGNKALTGGMVYRGTKITGLCGRYFYASWPDGGIKSLVTKDGKMVGGAVAHGGLGTGGLASFGEDGAGELYYATQGGEVYKIEAM